MNLVVTGASALDKDLFAVGMLILIDSIILHKQFTNVVRCVEDSLLWEDDIQSSF